MKIITQGKQFKKMRENHAVCANCGCGFIWDRTDTKRSKSLKKAYVVCPWCGEDVEVEDEH